MTITGSDRIRWSSRREICFRVSDPGEHDAGVGGLLVNRAVLSRAEPGKRAGSSAKVSLGDWIAAATNEVDRMIRDIRTALFGLAENRLALAKSAWRARRVRCRQPR
jgi:hypothetical protein